MEEERSRSFQRRELMGNSNGKELCVVHLMGAYPRSV